MPSGLLKEEIDARGAGARYAYDTQGDLRESLDRAALRTVYAYDELGRPLTETVFSKAFPRGVTTATSYDRLGNVQTVTGPVVVNRVSGKPHQQRMTYTYDRNQNLLEQGVEDLVGSDPPRVSTFRYNKADQQTSITDAEKGTLTRVFDAAGNVEQVTDQLGRVIEGTYKQPQPPRGPGCQGLRGSDGGHSAPDVVLQRYRYDLAGQKTAEIDALGRERRIAYDKAGRRLGVTLLGYHNRDGTTRDIVLSSTTYDRAGHPIREETGGWPERGGPTAMTPPAGS